MRGRFLHPAVFSTMLCWWRELPAKSDVWPHESADTTSPPSSGRRFLPHTTPASAGVFFCGTYASPKVGICWIKGSIPNG